MGEDLPVRKGAVHGSPHGLEILPPHLRMERSAGKLPIGNGKIALMHSRQHLSGVVRRHLVAKASGAAVEADDHVAKPKAVRSSDRFIVDRTNLLDLKIVVARAEGAHLIMLAPFGCV